MRNAALDLTIVHADMPTLLDNPVIIDFKASRIYSTLTSRLAAAGAECVVVTSPHAESLARSI